MPVKSSLSVKYPSLSVSLFIFVILIVLGMIIAPIALMVFDDRLEIMSVVKCECHER
jgi:hypothetical protein